MKETLEQVAQRILDQTPPFKDSQGNKLKLILSECTQATQDEFYRIAKYKLEMLAWNG